MSKYDALWMWIKENGTDSFKLTFAEIERIAGLVSLAVPLLLLALLAVFFLPVLGIL